MLISCDQGHISKDTGNYSGRFYCRDCDDFVLAHKQYPTPVGIHVHYSINGEDIRVDCVICYAPVARIIGESLDECRKYANAWFEGQP